MTASEHRQARRHFLTTSLSLAGAAGLARAAAPESNDTSQLGRTPHTKFAVNVEMWWRKLRFTERIKAAAAFGYPAIEFWPWRVKNIDDIAELTGELGIEVAQFTAWGFRPGLNNPQNHDRFVEEIEASCETAKKLRCKKMTVVGGDDQPGMTQEEMHEQIVVGLERAAPIAEKHDVMLILEPMNIRVDHKGHSLYGSPPAVRICEAVGSTQDQLNTGRQTLASS